MTLPELAPAPPPQQQRRRSRTAWSLAVAGLAGLVTADGTGLLDGATSQLVDDLGQLSAGALAALACWWTWRRDPCPERRWRLLLFLGMAGWVAGMAIWTWYQVFGDDELPSPSLADVGFFLLPLLAIPALWSLPTRAREGPEPVTHRSRGVLALDGLVVVGSLFVLTWATALGAAVRAGAATPAQFLVALGYPVTDLLMVVIVVLFAVFRRPRNPSALLLLGLGLVCLSVSDSLFLYLVSTGAGTMGPLYNIGFVAGPMLIALAALEPLPAPLPRLEDPVNGLADWALIVLPYLPLLCTGLVVLGQVLTDQRPDRVETCTGLAVLSLVVLRQFVILVDHLRLLREVRHGRELLRRQVFHDSLTGLANRALFHDRMDHATEVHRRDLRPLALLYCDLDDFKQINDTFGHAAGDELLREVAHRLRACAQPADTVARLGGDEFAVLLENGFDIPERVGERLLAALAEPFLLSGRDGTQPATVYVGASLGLVAVRAGDRPVGTDALLRRADLAMYRAKNQGKGRLVTIEPGDAAEPGTPSTRFGDRLRGGLSGVRHDPADGELDVAYQPIVRLADSQVVAVEALARWTHPELGTVATTLLIAEAEQAGVLDTLERRVLEQACQDVARLRAGRAPQLRVHVNVSAEQAGQTGLLRLVTELLTRYRLPGSALVLEITETRRAPDLDAAREVLGRLREIGVRLALDDFGACCSGISYLLDLPVDILKLDRALSTGSGDAQRAQRAREVTRATASMSRGLGLELIAEGVETQDQVRRLIALGCEYGQGHLFSPPGRLTEMEPATSPPRLPAADADGVRAQ